MRQEKEPLYSRCALCGRACGVDRDAGERGFCGEDARLKIAWAGIHRGEEPVICGAGGSGAVFFSGCTLRCFFCQNRQLSGEGIGRTVSVDEFASICLELEAGGAENINLVTGTHFIPSIVRGVRESRSRGLRLPVVWNSSGYDTQEGIDALADTVDVFVPDLKTLDEDLSASLFGIRDYPRTAAAALRRMAGLRPLVISGETLASGLIVRHLVLPGLLENTRKVLAWFAENLAGEALISVMFQYTPLESLGREADELPGEWRRRVGPREYDRVLGFLDDLGIEEGFLQDIDGSGSLLPDFSAREAFPRKLASPVWFHGEAGGR